MEKLGDRMKRIVTHLCLALPGIIVLILCFPKLPNIKTISETETVVFVFAFINVAINFLTIIFNIIVKNKHKNYIDILGIILMVLCIASFLIVLPITLFLLIFFIYKLLGIIWLPKPR